MKCLVDWFRSMKLIITSGIMAIGFVLISCAPMYSNNGGATVSGGFSASYSDLSPWGGWVVSARYGQVWHPDVASDWSPYSDGNWVWTDAGWYWSSYEPYGWMVYHYGNWYYDDSFGWCWVPGNTWYPANVTWVSYDNCVAWAPAPPRGITWSRPWVRTSNYSPWHVVASRDITREDVMKYRVSASAPSGGSERSVRFRAPDIQVINRTAPQPMARVTIKREQQVVGNRRFVRAVLPSLEMAKVERYQGRGARYKNPADRRQQQQPQKQDTKNKGKGGGHERGDRGDGGHNPH